MNLPFQIKYYRGEVFRQWCKELLQADHASGDYLVKLLGGPFYPHYDYGMTDNVRAAQEFLRLGRKAAWFFRNELRPSVEQQFFGIGGSSYNHASGIYFIDFTYRPNKKYKPFLAFVETGKVGRIRNLKEETLLRIEGFK
jgi:hypothetical protein